MVTVVGIGPGHPDYVTPAATKRIAEADILIGGKRALQAVGAEGKEVYEITAHIDTVLRIIDDNKDRNVAVLVSGDPGFYSMLKTIRTRLPHVPLDVVPGISSVQVLFSSIAREWHDVSFTSVHGRALSGLDDVIRNNKNICILTDDKITAPEVARYLTGLGVTGRAVAGKNLSYPDQVVIDTTIQALAESDGLESCVLYIETEG